jgi:hypothetical protein
VSAQIPFVVTRKTEAELRRLGYPQEAINQIPPAEAFQWVAEGLAYDPVAWLEFVRQLAAREDAEERAAIQAEARESNDDADF